jgi:hypothetical protein
MALQEEIWEMERQLLGAMNKALERQTSPYDRERCRRAYYRLMLAQQDIIGQRHGLQPMLWKD